MRTKRLLATIGLFIAALALYASPARANDLTSPNAAVDCSGYNFTVEINGAGGSVTVPNTYHVVYSFTLTPTTGTPIDVSGELLYTATTDLTPVTVSSGTQVWPGSPLTVPYTVTGMVVLLEEPGTPVSNITFNGTSSTSILLNCSAGGCPATIGFWKNVKKHPFPASVKASGLSIGGVTYSASQLLTILGNSSVGNAVKILGKQLVGALLNLAAGARSNPTATSAITDAENLLQTNSLNLLTSVVPANSALGQSLLTDGTTLDGYNSSDFNTCSEGSGLVY